MQSKGVDMYDWGGNGDLLDTTINRSVSVITSIGLDHQETLEQVGSLRIGPLPVARQVESRQGVESTWIYGQDFLSKTKSDFSWLDVELELSGTYQEAVAGWKLFLFMERQSWNLDLRL